MALLPSPPLRTAPKGHPAAFTRLPSRRGSSGCPLGANALVKERADELIVIFTDTSKEQLSFRLCNPRPRHPAVGHRHVCSHFRDRPCKTRIHCPSASHLAVTSDGGALWARVGGTLSVAEGVLVAEYKVTSGFLLCNSYQHDFMSHPNTDMSGAGQSQPAPTKAE